jgi:hypothetical protein
LKSRIDEPCGRENELPFFGKLLPQSGKMFPKIGSIPLVLPVGKCG